MLKKYKQFESLLDKISGPSEEDLFKYIKENPNKGLIRCVSKQLDYLQGVKYALENGADINYEDTQTNLNAIELAMFNSYYDSFYYLFNNGGLIDKNQFGLDFVISEICDNIDYDMFIKIIKYYGYMSLKEAISIKNKIRIKDENKDIIKYLEQYIKNIDEYIKNYIKNT